MILFHAHRYLMTVLFAPMGAWHIRWKDHFTG